MIPEADFRRWQQEALTRLRSAGVIVTAEEAGRIEIADFGLGRFEAIGLGILVYVNTDRCCAKELVLWPRQTCPEHQHPAVGSRLGKEETFRCRSGQVFLYVEGEPSRVRMGQPPPGTEGTFTVWHEVLLGPGGQHTIPPATLHWFQAGAEGAVVSEFSTTSTDEFDQFTDPAIQRITRIG